MVSEINKKYFFDHNNFDSPSADSQVEEEIVEARLYDEAAMEREAKKAYQEGFKKASDEMRQSQSQHLNNTVDLLSVELGKLFAQEKLRETLYEQDVVNITRAAFENIYPFYAQNIGFDALVLALSDHLQAHKAHQGLVIHCAPDLVKQVEEALKKIGDTHPDLAFDVHGDDDLLAGACRIAWESGGMVHDPDAMAREVVKILQDGLAGTPPSSHDDGDVIDGVLGESNE